jgi:hypothetical protein
MSAIKLPTTGEDLAYATREFVGQAYEQVREELEFNYLPQALLAIWAHSPLFKEARKGSLSQSVRSARSATSSLPSLG